MRSMTGYAYNEEICENYTISVEFKSVNSRFLDLSINMPFFMNRLESRFKEKITSKIARGKVDVYLKLKETNQNLIVDVNTEAAKVYSDAIKKVALAVGNTENVPLNLIIQQEGVLLPQKKNDIEYYWNIFENIFDKTLTDFIIDKEREGENLKIDLVNSLSRIEQAHEVFCYWQPKMEEIFKQNILKRFNELLGDNIDMQRVMQETASLLIKYTINEEIVRLKSHIESLKKEITNNPFPGKKMDFICQELNREINTIGSKNQLIEIGESVIGAKDALENIREQARNVE